MNMPVLNTDVIVIAMFGIGVSYFVACLIIFTIWDCFELTGCSTYGEVICRIAQSLYILVIAIVFVEVVSTIINGALGMLI